MEKSKVMVLAAPPEGTQGMVRASVGSPNPVPLLAKLTTTSEADSEPVKSKLNPLNTNPWPGALPVEATVKFPVTP